MVAGGVGLAPFATLAEALAARGTPMTLFYGARAAADLYYAELFERSAPGSSSRPKTARAASAAASPRRSSARCAARRPIAP